MQKRRYYLLTRTKRTRTGCALWQGARTKDGYARTRLLIDGKIKYRMAHRLAYANAHDILLEDVPQLRNTCSLKHCINSGHWEPA